MKVIFDRVGQQNHLEGWRGQSVSRHIGVLKK